MNFITWNEPKLKMFKEEFNKHQKGDVFLFEGNEFLYDYAKYLIEYLDQRLAIGGKYTTQVNGLHPSGSKNQLKHTTQVGGGKKVEELLDALEEAEAGLQEALGDITDHFTSKHVRGYLETVQETIKKWRI